MGLDQYMYVAQRAGQQTEFYDGAEFDETIREFRNPNVSKPREIAYRRKHPNLHGWMKKLWLHKNGFASTDDQQFIQDESVPSFNGIEVELTTQDLDQLEHDVRHKKLPDTGGFFFGNDADQHYYNQDLAFVKAARVELFMGLKVFYNSSW